MHSGDVAPLTGFRPGPFGHQLMSLQLGYNTPPQAQSPKNQAKIQIGLSNGS